MKILMHRNRCNCSGQRIRKDSFCRQSTILLPLLVLLSESPSSAFSVKTRTGVLRRDRTETYSSRRASNDLIARPFRPSYDGPDEVECSFVLDRSSAKVSDAVRTNTDAEDSKSWGRSPVKDDAGEEMIRTEQKSRQTYDEDFKQWAPKGLGHWPFSPKLSDTKLCAPRECSVDESGIEPPPVQDDNDVADRDETTTPLSDVAIPEILFESHEQVNGLPNVEAFLQKAQNATAYKQMTDRMDELLSMPALLPDLVHRAAAVVSNTSSEAGESATRLLDVTDSLLSKGYVNGDPLAGKEEALLRDVHEQQEKVAKTTPTKTRDDPKALFDSFGITAVEMNDWTAGLERVSRMARLAAAIYSPDEEIVSSLLNEGESLVATGKTCNVKWAVTDSLVQDVATEAIGTKPQMIRTLTIRGYDASDESVDRKDLFYTICDAQAVPLGNMKTGPQILVHKGLFELAKALYTDVQHYLLDWSSHGTKIVIGGHSIGGALSNLVLFLITMDRGADFVSQRVEQVYTFGAPPVAVVKPTQGPQTRSKTHENGKTPVPEEDFQCDILSALKLPSSIVESHVQPWDPIVRLFAECDPLYPLIGEIDIENGDDGMLLWPRGPPRVLRHVTGAIIEAWGEGWPDFRDNFKKNSNQTYTAVGIQHLLLPEPKRYLTDRFLSVDVAVPPVQTILRLSSQDLFPAVKKAFPLDVFEISYVPQAIRSFLHHFFPAYSETLVGFVDRLRVEKEKLDPDYNVVSSSRSEKENDDDDVPCYILDMDSDEAAAIVVEALQRTPSSSSVSTTLSTLAAVSTEVASDSRQGRKRHPLKRMTNWLRRGKQDLRP